MRRGRRRIRLVAVPLSDDHGIIQVVVIPVYQEPLRRWLTRAGLKLFPIPNGHDADGNPAFTADDLPTFGIGTP